MLVRLPCLLVIIFSGYMMFLGMRYNIFEVLPFIGLVLGTSFLIAFFGIFLKPFRRITSVIVVFSGALLLIPTGLSLFAGGLPSPDGLAEIPTHYSLMFLIFILLSMAGSVFALEMDGKGGRS